MIRYTNILFRIGVILTVHAPAARGQASAATWGFVNARYDPRSSASIITGYGWHRGFAMAGVQHNPRSGYAEVLGGVGAVFRTGASARHWVALGAARTGAGSLAQFYWLPTVRTGGVTTRATVKWSVAQHGSAPQKLTIAPLSMMLPVARWLAGGVAVEMSAAEGARTNIGTGVEFRLKLPGAAFGADALRDVTGNSSRLRMFFFSLF